MDDMADFPKSFHILSILFFLHVFDVFLIFSADSCTKANITACPVLSVEMPPCQKTLCVAEAAEVLKELDHLDEAADKLISTGKAVMNVFKAVQEEEDDDNATAVGLGVFLFVCFIVGLLGYLAYLTRNRTRTQDVQAPRLDPDVENPPPSPDLSGHLPPSASSKHYATSMREEALPTGCEIEKEEKSNGSMIQEPYGVVHPKPLKKEIKKPTKIRCQELEANLDKMEDINEIESNEESFEQHDLSVMSVNGMSVKDEGGKRDQSVGDLNVKVSDCVGGGKKDVKEGLECVDGEKVEADLNKRVPLVEAGMEALKAQFQTVKDNLAKTVQEQMELAAKTMADSEAEAVKAYEEMKKQLCHQ